MLLATATESFCVPIRGRFRDTGDGYGTCRGRSQTCGFFPAEDKRSFCFPEGYTGNLPSGAYFDQDLGLFRIDNVTIIEGMCEDDEDEDEDGDGDTLIECTTIYY